MREEELSACLDRCIELLQAGASLEECLMAHPHAASQLEPLLRAAVALQQLHVPAPRPSLHRELWENIINASSAAVTHRPPNRYLLWEGLDRRKHHEKRRRIMSGLVAAVALAIALTAGAVRTSERALPGDILYPVKEAVQRAEAALARSADARLILQVQFAERRLAEVEAALEGAASATVPPQAELSLVRLQEELALAEQLAPGASNAARQLAAQRLQLQVERLSQLCEHLRERLMTQEGQAREHSQAVTALQRAMQNLERTQERLWAREQESSHGAPVSAPRATPSPAFTSTRTPGTRATPQAQPTAGTTASPGQLPTGEQEREREQARTRERSGEQGPAQVQEQERQQTQEQPQQQDRTQGQEPLWQHEPQATSPQQQGQVGGAGEQGGQSGAPGVPAEELPAQGSPAGAGPAEPREQPSVAPGAGPGPGASGGRAR